MEFCDNLVDLLSLERLDRDLFRARNGRPTPRNTLYGGQVAAQCLQAAAATIDAGRMPHSLHGYFLRPGSSAHPVLLHVDRERDGRSFSARHVVAVQEGEVIFSMVASFQLERPGAVLDEALHHDLEAPEGPGHPSEWNSMLRMQPVSPIDPALGTYPDQMWVRAADDLGDDPVRHAAALVYLSDLSSGFGQRVAEVGSQGGPSIDHTVWFHAPIRADRWVLLDLEPVKAWATRGLYHGSLRDADGVLAAVVAQEHLLLPLNPTTS